MSDHEHAIEQLKQDLDPALVSSRAGFKGRKLNFIEAFTMIEQANRIFGYDGWSMRTEWTHYLATGGQRTDSDTGEVFQVGVYTALVHVEALGRHRSGVGTSTVSDSTNPDAHDTAIKGAESDAMKRALRTFGDQFGNGLYDKGRRGDGAQVQRVNTPPAPAQSDSAGFGEWCRRFGVTEADVRDIIRTQPTWQNITAWVRSRGKQQATLKDVIEAVTFALPRALPAEATQTTPAPAQAPAQTPTNGSDPTICPQCGGSKGADFRLCRECQQVKTDRYVPCPAGCGNRYDPTKYTMCRDCAAKS